MSPDLAQITDTHGVISARRNPAWADRLIYLARKGLVVRLLPGIYTAPERVGDLETRAAAACSYDPTGVVLGEAAAALSFWRELRPDTIVVASRSARAAQPGFIFVRRAIPSALTNTRRGIRYTNAALTALDLVEVHGGEALDRALNSRRTTVAQLRDTLARTPRRRGNTDRRAALLDSRDGGWSALERAMHRLLREAGIDGWSANALVDTRYTEYVVDIAFHHSRLCIELDGEEFHGASKFDDDRRRGNELLLAGRQVLHFTWAMVDRTPDRVISTVRRALALFPVGSAPR